MECQRMKAINKIMVKKKNTARNSMKKTKMTNSSKRSSYPNTDDFKFKNFKR